MDGVLRSADHGGANALVGLLDARPPGGNARQDCTRQTRAQVAERFCLPTINIFRDAARKSDDIGCASVLHCLKSQQFGGVGVKRCAADGFKQAIRHLFNELVQHISINNRADFKVGPDNRREALSCFLYACNVSVLVKRQDARADIYCRHIHHRTIFAHRDLRGAAADIDIHHAHAFADRARRCARTEGGERRLQCIASAYRDKFACLCGKQLGNGAGIAAAYCYTRQYQRASIDSARINLGQIVLRIDEHAKRDCVNRLIGGIGGE